MAVLAPFPTFLIIGFRRNATRWLRFNLDAHPEICAPPIYPRFFSDPDRMAALGLRWYCEQFSEWDGEPFLGEASWTYLDQAHGQFAACERIHRLIPDVRLIAIVDNPLIRFASAVRERVRWGELPADVDLDAIFVGAAHVDVGIATLIEGMQHLSLDPYLQRFGDQVLTILVDDIRTDPQATYRRVLEHIGAEPSFVPDDLDVVRYSNRPVIDLPMPDLPTLQFLYAWYRSDVDLLAEAIGRDLSGWDPGAGPTTPSPEQILELILRFSGTGS